MGFAVFLIDQAVEGARPGPSSHHGEPLPSVAELETTKEILTEVFHVQSSEVEETIRQRLEVRCLAAERGPLSDGELWPETFCLGE